MWTWSTGLGIAVAGGLESAAIRPAWVSGDPAATIWGSRGRQVGFPRGRRHESPMNGGLEGAADGSVDLPRSAARGLAASGLALLAAIPPNSHAHLTRAKAGWRAATSLPRDRHKTQEQIKTFQKTNKTKRGEGTTLTVRSGLLSRCTHEGGTGTRRRGRKLK